MYFLNNTFDNLTQIKAKESNLIIKLQTLILPDAIN